MKKQYELVDLNTEGKIYVGIPRERFYIPYFVDNRDKIMGTLNSVGRAAGMYQHSSHRVDRNRDNIVDQFLNAKGKPEWLQFLDSDMDHPLDISIRLSKWGKPIVAGLYFHRNDTHMPFLFKESEMGKSRYGKPQKVWTPMSDAVYKFFSENQVPDLDGALSISDYKGEALIECDAVATGTMLIHRSVLELMEKPIFEYREGGSSEDLQFCYEAKNDYGIPIYCDLSTISGHYIFYPVSAGKFMRTYKMRGVTFSGYSPNDAVKWLTKFLDIPKQDAAERFQKGNAHMAGDYWNARFEGKKPTPVEISEFYKDPYVGKLYLIELLHWNLSQTFHHIKGLFKDIRNQKVLEIGSGIGSLVIQLSIQDCEVTACEINKTLNEFAKMRIKDLNKSIIEKTKDVEFDENSDWVNKPDGYFDTVVSTDTFEHIPEPDIVKMLKDINRVLKPGGKLVYHANFGQQNLYPMHYDHSEMWDAWLIQAGFMPVNSNMAVKRSEQWDG